MYLSITAGILWSLFAMPDDAGVWWGGLVVALLAAMILAWVNGKAAKNRDGGDIWISRGAPVCGEHGGTPIVGCAACGARYGIFPPEADGKPEPPKRHEWAPRFLWLCAGAALGAIAMFNMLMLYLILSGTVVALRTFTSGGGD